MDKIGGGNSDPGMRDPLSGERRDQMVPLPLLIISKGRDTSASMNKLGNVLSWSTIIGGSFKALETNAGT